MVVALRWQSWSQLNIARSRGATITTLKSKEKQWIKAGFTEIHSLMDTVLYCFKETLTVNCRSCGKPVVFSAIGGLEKGLTENLRLYTLARTVVRNCSCLLFPVTSCEEAFLKHVWKKWPICHAPVFLSTVESLHLTGRWPEIFPLLQVLSLKFCLATSRSKSLVFSWFNNLLHCLDFPWPC